jgi:murein DD-endopeptidase MepM/ murein hydrolase activator NlpD
MIRIKHPGGYVTLYGHLDRIHVEDGAWVNSGAVIGKMGNTGRSTGTHLHYEVRQWGKTVNPLRVTIF